jgi:hypothetical protein
MYPSAARCIYGACCSQYDERRCPDDRSDKIPAHRYSCYDNGDSRKAKENPLAPEIREEIARPAGADILVQNYYSDSAPRSFYIPGWHW